MPTRRQLEQASQLIWTQFGGARLGSGSVRSVKQLVYLIDLLRRCPTAKEIIESQNRFLQNADVAVQQTLDFIKLWAMFNFPKFLRALDWIQRDVFGRLGMRTGNYETFAASVENLFLDPAIVMLDEYGIPLELARKLEDVLQSNGDLDAALEALKRFTPQDSSLTRFEQDLVLDAQKYI